MKKLILASVFTLVGLTAFAQEGENNSLMASPDAVTITEDGFTEITMDKLPEAVIAAVTKDFATTTVSKAYVNEEMQYKIELSNEEGSISTVYADEEGNWIEL